MPQPGRIKRINNKFYDIGTPNKSFIQVALDLKKLGINNYYFMLEVKDPYVVDIDPYAPNLTRDQISRVINECTRNIWYYLREVARIPEQGGTSIKYLANRGNIAQAWCIINGVDSWLNLPRQQGKTQSALAAQSWAYSYGTTNSQMIFVNKSGGDANTNLGRLKDQIDLLPEYMHYESVFDENGKTVKMIRNTTKIRHPITKNEIITKSKATSLESALNLARGLTAPIMHFDEPEFTSRIKTIVENSAPTYAKASANAKRNGGLYARIFTSTPGDLDTPAGQEAQLILQDTVKWTEKMYDWSEQEVRNYIKNNSKNDIVYIEYSYKQLGLTEEWFENIARKIGNPQTVKREVLLQRLRGSSNSPFEQEDIEYITNNIKPVIEEIYLMENFRVDVYKPLNRRTPYIVGIDCSTGTNGDNNAITILDPYSVEPVAEFKCKYIGETDFIRLIIELVKKHIPKSIVVIERNSVGDAVVDILMNSPISHNLYFDKGKDLLDKNIDRNVSTISMLKHRAESKKYYGVYTSGASREDMINILIRHMNEFKDKFITANITNDISRLIRFSSGKIAAAPGFHDDSVMSYLIALYVYYHGDNLPLFGFVKGSKEIENQNQGTKRLDEVSVDFLPSEVVDAIKREEEIQNNDYDDILRNALMRSQQESIRQTHAGVIKNDVYKSAVENYLDETDDGSISLDFFDELNGL